MVTASGNVSLRARVHGRQSQLYGFLVRLRTVPGMEETLGGSPCQRPDSAIRHHDPLLSGLPGVVGVAKVPSRTLP